MSNIVAIVGRPNVGKSTLFNRLTQTRQAITDEISGVTRDRHYGKSEWSGKEFSVIDTGGYVDGSDDIFEKEIRKQVELAIDEANVILFLVDAKDGITDLDQAVVDLLRKSNKKVVLAVNKVDNSKLLEDAVEFHNLAMGDYITFSSISGSGTGELLDELVKHFEDEDEKQDDDLPKFAVIGRPNVGKSSFINALLEKDQNIVTDIAGTTRDSLNTRFNKFGFDLNESCLASDAFFPFSDCVEISHANNINSIVQPGGSIKDQDSIDFCNKNGMSMVFSGIRHFRH